jgi:hypothetical protein
MQAANVQMRILTEDSLSQIENMSATTDNVAALTHLASPVTSKAYFDLLQSAAATTTTTPVTMAKPMYQSVDTTLPIGAPKTPDTPPPDDLPKTPDVPPPGWNGSETPSLYGLETPQDIPLLGAETPLDGSPKTPDMPPPDWNPQDRVSFKLPSFADYYDDKNTQMGGETAAGGGSFTVGGSTWQTGGKVHLRGESKPSREWTIDKLGDHFMTIVTNDREGLHPGEEIRVVRPEDVIAGALLPPPPMQQPFMPHVGFQTGLMSAAAAANVAPAPPPANNIDIRIVQGDDKSTNNKLPGSSSGSGITIDTQPPQAPPQQPGNVVPLTKGAIVVTKKD